MSEFGTEYIHQRNDNIPVRRFGIKSLDVFEVTEDELELLGKYSEDDLFLNFAIFFSSFILSAFVSWLLSDFKEDSNKIIFWCIFSIAFIAALVFWSLWLIKKNNKKRIIEKIRARKTIIDDNCDKDD